MAQRFSMTMLGVFAGMALVLASVGIYGVLSYIVGQRTREIGIRIALGARQEHVLRWVMGGGAQMAVVGVGFGVVAALGLTRLMAGLLYGVSAVDPLTFAVVAGVLLWWRWWLVIFRRGGRCGWIRLWCCGTSKWRESAAEGFGDWETPRWG